MSPAPRNLVALAFVAFVSLGLPDCVLGVAWPSMRQDFRRPLSHLGQLLAAGTTGYLCSSFFGGQILRAVGVGKLLVGSSLLVTISLAAYWLAPVWPVAVTAALVGGLGAGAIDTGINTVAAHRFSPRVVNWLHASWGIGATAGPLLMTAVLATRHGWRAGYAILAAALLGLAVLFATTLRLWEDDRADAPAAGGEPHEAASLAEALRRPAVWAQALIFFVYAGLESTAGQLLYTLLTESRGVGVTAAGVTVGAYWAALTVGRIVFGQVAAARGPRVVLRAGMTIAPLAAALIAWNPANVVTFAAAGLLGFGLAPVFPTLIAVTPQRVGKRYAGHAVGFQVAAASVGIATFPGVVAMAARARGLEVVGAYLVGASVVLLLMHEGVVRMSGGRTRPASAPVERGVEGSTG